MLHPLDDAFVQRRMDAKYGSVRLPSAVCTTETLAYATDDTFIHFIDAPVEGTLGVSVVYAPRSNALDSRRQRLCDVYRCAGELLDLRDTITVPACLMHIARAGMRHVSSPGPVRIHDMLVAVVSTRNVGALLYEVVRNTCDLEARRCTRLVAHMCKNDAIATEWLACFGI
jgi:hypothetical protein